MIHLPTFAELKQFVRQVLCYRTDLNHSTPLLEKALLRRLQPCGIEYTLLAPRCLRLSAIWDAAGDRILFYDQNLNRFQITPIQGPEISRIGEHSFEKLNLDSIWKGK